MFFPMLRRQAKWVFVFLALVFGVGFVVFGVGSGAGLGLGDILGKGSSSSGPSASDARDKIDKNPNDAAAWRELATALTNSNKTAEAIPALERYVTLKPKDYDAMRELSGDYEGQATRLRADADTVQADLNETTGGQTFGIQSSTKLGRAVGEGAIDRQLTTLANKQLTDDYTGIQKAYTRASQLYQRISAGQPDDTLAVAHLGDLAYQAQNIPLAIASDDRFLNLAPDDPQATYVKQQLIILRAQLKTGGLGGR